VTVFHVQCGFEFCVTAECECGNLQNEARSTNARKHTHSDEINEKTNWVHSTKDFLCIFLMSLYTSESSEHHLIAKLCTFTNLTAQETKNPMYTKQSSKTGRKPNSKFQNQSGH
jgi:hypothetical protein